MSWIERQLGQMPDPEIVLHIGAGSCSELPDYRRVAPERIVLVEPNPGSCAELRARATGWDNVTVLQAAVAEHTGSASLRLFNFPELDSLREPVGLYSLLPGLCQVGRVEVPTLTAGQLIAQLSLNADGRNWLVLEAPGEELAIITALAEAQALESFSRLIVRAGSEAFYDGTPSSSQAVLEALEQRGYTAQASSDLTDADWPRHHLRLDRMALECRRLKAELAEQKKWEQEHKADLDAIQKALRSVQEVLAEAEKARTQAEEGHRAELAEAQQAHEKAAQKLQEELAQSRQKHIEALAEAEQAQQKGSHKVKALESALAERKSTSEKLGIELHEHKKELARLTQAYDEAQKKLTEAEQKLASLAEQQNQLKALEEEDASLRTQLEAEAKETAESTKKLQEKLAQAEQAHKSEREAARKELATVQASSEQKVQELQAALAEQKQALTEAKQAKSQAAQQNQTQLEKAQADLSLSLRLQMLRENDLKELQTRYGEVLTIKDEQQDLLNQLHHRLSRAAEYLQLVHAQSDDQRLPDELLEALTGKGESAR